jgi:thioredoxin 1
MRIIIACLLLLVAPAAIVVGFKEYQAYQAEQQRLQLPTRGEVLFFNATWCGPCRRMKPVVSTMRRQGYRLRDVDVDRNRQLAEQYGVQAVPTFVFLENGSEVNRFSGGTTPENLRRLCAGPAYH